MACMRVGKPGRRRRRVEAGNDAALMRRNSLRDDDYECHRRSAPPPSLLVLLLSTICLLSAPLHTSCSNSRSSRYDSFSRGDRARGRGGEVVGGYSTSRRRINATSVPWMSFLDDATPLDVEKEQERQPKHLSDTTGGGGGSSAGGSSSGSSAPAPPAQSDGGVGIAAVGGGVAATAAAAAGAEAAGIAAGNGAGKALSENYYVSHLGQLPQHMTGKTPQVTRWIPAVRMSKNGEIEAAEVSRSATAADLRCPLRDMRLVDPTFPGQFPKVIARRSAIIMSINCVKAIIKKDEILLFHPDEATTKELVNAMRQQLPAHGVPFEQVAMEACLAEVCQSFRRSVQGVVLPLNKFISGIRFGDSLSINLDALLPLKNRLGELHSKITETVKALNEVLMSDEDMSLMYLTEPREDISMHEEIEMMLENYLMQAEMLTKELVDYQTLVRNMEEVLEINLDFQRNRIMKYELVMSFTGLIVTSGALVTGVFGMNLFSGWETRPNIFWLITGGIYTFIFSALAMALLKLRKQHII